MSYSSATEQIKSEQQEIKSFRLATVSALFEDNCPKITFFGEETPSEKKYKILDDTNYAVNDTVLVGIVNDGYIILGSVGFSPSGGGNVTVYLTEEQANILYAVKSHTHTEYAATNHTHSAYASTNHTHSQYSETDHKHNTLYWNTDPASSTSGIKYESGAFRPTDSSVTPTIGTSTYKFGQIYSTNSVISTSDENKKNSIEPLDERYEKFIMLLLSVRYKFNDGSSDRYHPGFTAQQVELAMKESGLTDLEFAGFIKSPKVDEEGNEIEGYDYGLRYEEFISPMAKVLQNVLIKYESQAIKISDMDKRLTELEGRVSIG